MTIAVWTRQLDLRLYQQTGPIIAAFVAVLVHDFEPGRLRTACVRLSLPVEPIVVYLAFSAHSRVKSGEVTLHTLGHTAISRLIASEYDDYTAMEISGRSTCPAWSQTGHKRKTPSGTMPRRRQESPNY